MPFPDRLPRTEVFSGKITPRDTDPVSVDDAFDDLAIVLEWAGSLAPVGGQEWFDAFPLFVGENVMFLICSHPFSVSAVKSSIKETRCESCSGRSGTGWRE